MTISYEIEKYMPLTGQWVATVGSYRSRISALYEMTEAELRDAGVKYRIVRITREILE